MKKEIMGYVTGMVNNCMRAMTYCRETNDSTRAEDFKDYINELTDLLDFIEDIPEEGQALSDVKLQEYVEGIEKDNKFLRAEIVQKSVATIVWEESCTALKKRNAELEKENKCLLNLLEEKVKAIYELESEIRGLSNTMNELIGGDK